MRLIGIDYGLRRTGIALGETETGLALPFEMFEGLPDAELARAIARLCRQEGAEAIVIGVPRHDDGASSQQTKLTEKFVSLLEAAVAAGGGKGPGGGAEGRGKALPIHQINEHLTSHDSEGKLAGHFTRQQKRQRVDAIAAARILQDWLDRPESKSV